jgi:hypothetical protein
MRGAGRITVGRVLVGVGVVALNLALLRAGLRGNETAEGIRLPWAISSTLLMMNLLGYGCWRTSQKESKSRRFWVGFVVAGAAAVLGVVAFFLAARLEWIVALDQTISDALMNITAFEWLVDHQDQLLAASVGAWALGVGLVSAGFGLPMVVIAVCGGKVSELLGARSLNQARG